MGVPTVTRKGDRFLARAGQSFAHAAGMPGWIAEDDDAYVEKAIAFASDVGELDRIRRSLRGQVQASPLFDGKRFAHALERVLWGMWDTHVSA
jgi:predicted O-linked N-acetylglucosamine transferase (SPINDLY family)